MNRETLQLFTLRQKSWIHEEFWKRYMCICMHVCACMCIYIHIFPTVFGELILGHAKDTKTHVCLGLFYKITYNLYTFCCILLKSPLVHCSTYYNISTVHMVAKLYCLGNNDKEKSLHIFNPDGLFLKYSSFMVGWITDREPADTESWLCTCISTVQHILCLHIYTYV